MLCPHFQEGFDSEYHIIGRLVPMGLMAGEQILLALTLNCDVDRNLVWFSVFFDTPVMALTIKSYL